MFVASDGILFTAFLASSDPEVRRDHQSDCVFKLQAAEGPPCEDAARSPKAIPVNRTPTQTRNSRQSIPIHSPGRGRKQLHGKNLGNKFPGAQWISSPFQCRRCGYEFGKGFEAAPVAAVYWADSPDISRGCARCRGSVYPTPS